MAIHSYEHGDKMSGDQFMSVFTKFAFPFKLHTMLDEVEKDGNNSIASWQPHGKAFRIHNPKEFAEKVLPKYFEKTKFRSFQRQLHIYGFTRIRDKKLTDYNAYYHELFQRGKVELSVDMKRQKIKGDKAKMSAYKKPQPDFYSKSSSKTSAGPRFNCRSQKNESIASQSFALEALIEKMEKSAPSLELIKESQQFISNNFTPISNEPRPLLMCPSSVVPITKMKKQQLETSFPCDPGFSSFQMGSCGSTQLPCTAGLSSVTSYHTGTGPLHSMDNCRGDSSSNTALNTTQFNLLSHVPSGNYSDLVANLGAYHNTTDTPAARPFIFPRNEGDEIDFEDKTFHFTSSYYTK